jgi:hypothetical protein
MNRSLLVLVSGLLLGVIVHLAYFETRKPGDVESIEGHLAWMRDQLRLSESQYAAILALHERTSPRLRELASHLERVRAEEAQFEKVRVSGDQVDLLAFGELVDERREVGRESRASSAELVGRLSGILTPDQRRRFVALVPAIGQVMAPDSR